MKATIEQVKGMVAILTSEEQQALKDAIIYGGWGDAEYEFFKAPDSNETETVYMYGYCTNDAKQGGHFEGRKMSALFRNIYRKMCKDERHQIGYVLSHCNDWWGDGSGDMLFIREGWDATFEEWSKI